MGMTVIVDGAHEGVLPWAAVQHLMNGTDIKANGVLGREELACWINEAPAPGYFVQHGQSRSQKDFDDEARAIARAMLMHFQQYPNDTELPLLSKHIKRGGIMIRCRLGLADLLSELYGGFSAIQYSYFQLGWAANAARSILGLSPTPNPGLRDYESGPLVLNAQMQIT